MKEIIILIMLTGIFVLALCVYEKMYKPHKATVNLIILIWSALIVMFLSSCTTIKVVHQRPNLRRVPGELFTDEKNKLYIYIKKP